MSPDAADLPPEWGRVLEALAILLQGKRNPTIIVTDTDGSQYNLRLPAPTGPPREEVAPTPGPAPMTQGREPTRGCGADVLRAMRDADCRLTTSQIMDALAAAGKEWSERQVKRCLVGLQEVGAIDKNPNAEPPGYGLVT